MNNELKKPVLFNVNGGDSYHDQTIFGGNPTGIANLNQQRYGWVNTLYRNMLGNNWFPQKVNLTEDKLNLSKLTPDEELALKRTLSFLIFLDSYQTNNLPNLADYVTNSGLKQLLIVQAYQEVIHSESYQYALEALYPTLERDEIYNMWRGDPVLAERNKMIADIGQAFVDEPSPENLMKNVCANLVLEGLYFYQGFNLFDQLASRGKSVGLATLISGYIKRDEIGHVAIFTNMIKELGVKAVEPYLVPLMEQGTQSEIKFCHHNYGNRILGITEHSSEQYIKHLCNQRLKAVGLGDIYEGVSNPYKHLDVNKRGNFFESGAITDYDMATSVEGWDEL